VPPNAILRTLEALRASLTVAPQHVVSAQRHCIILKAEDGFLPRNSRYASVVVGTMRCEDRKPRNAPIEPNQGYCASICRFPLLLVYIRIIDLLEVLDGRFVVSWFLKLD
jgi:hypothetical protein